MQPQYAADLHRQGEVATAAPRPHKSRRWIANLIGLAFVGGVVGVAIVGVIKLANDPASATITAATLKSQTSPSPSPNGELNGLYVDMSYPGAFNQVAQVKTDTNGLEEYTINSSANYRREITVDVKTLASGLPNDDANYRLREIQNTLYTPSQQTINEQVVYIMTKGDNTEETFFWPHAGKMLVVAITSTDPGDHVAAYLAAILPTVRWK